MSRIPVVYGKENKCCVEQPKVKVRVKQPLLEIPANIRVRSRSSSDAAGAVISAACCAPNNHLLVAKSKVARGCGGCVAPRSANLVQSGNRVFNFDVANPPAGCCRPQQPKVERGVQVHKAIPQPVNAKRPVKVQRRSSYKNSSKTSALPYVGDIYNLEYLDDIISNVMMEEREILLHPNFMRTYCQNATYRSMAIKWVQSLQVQIRFSDQVLYLSVNIFDQILARTPIKLEKYKILLLTTIWTVNKLIGNIDLYASRLVCYCESGYLPEYMSAQERFILRLLDYRIHTIEPTICVNYYLKVFNIAHLEVAHKAIRFVLHSFVHRPEYSCYPCSLIAIAAISIVVNFYFPDLSPQLEVYFHRYLNEEDRYSKRELEKIMSLKLPKQS